jgi:hypothetical protein
MKGTAMIILISFPVTTYIGFLGRCLLFSRECAVLKNGVVEQAPDAARGTIFIKIRCGREDAELLLRRAIRIYAAAIPYIAEAVQRSRQGGGNAPA